MIWNLNSSQFEYDDHAVELVARINTANDTANDFRAKCASMINTIVIVSSQRRREHDIWNLIYELYGIRTTSGESPRLETEDEKPV